MKRASAAALITLVLALITAAVGLSLRTASTTINYPPYSSLDNGEQGLRAFFETARRLGVPVERNYRSLTRTLGSKGTLVYAQTSIPSVREGEIKELDLFERVAKPGMRLVFLINDVEEEFVSATEQPTGRSTTNDAKPADPAGKKSDTRNDSNSKPADKKGSKPAKRKESEDTLLRHWGVEMKSVDIPDAPMNEGRMGRAASNYGKWVKRSWFFAHWSDQWKPAAGSDGRVYLLERSFDAGSIVLLLGLDAFTNKTLLTKVDSTRIAATLSGPHPLIFDEAHLGVADYDTVAGYARERHFQWLLVGLLVLAGLYVWRSSVSFVPALPEIKGADVVGRNAHMALASLLNQSIERSALPREIIAAWRDSFHMLPSSKVRVIDASLEALAKAGDAAAPSEYVAISRAVLRRGAAP